MVPGVATRPDAILPFEASKLLEGNASNQYESRNVGTNEMHRIEATALAMREVAQSVNSRCSA